MCGTVCVGGGRLHKVHEEGRGVRGEEPTTAEIRLGQIKAVIAFRPSAETWEGGSCGPQPKPALRFEM